MKTVTSGFEQIKNYVDIVGISTYGYAFYSHDDKGNPTHLPTNWLSQIQTIAPNKEYAVVETAWIAEDLNIPSFSINVSSDEQKQSAYISSLFEEATKIDAKTIIWFTSYDYDTLWTDTFGVFNLSKIWKDTGLIDQNLIERDSLEVWKNELKKIRE